MNPVFRPFWRRGPDGPLLVVRLTPKASADRIDGVGEDGEGRAILLARVRAVPEDGRANAALIGLLAKALKLPKTRLAVSAGHAARLKTVRIEGDADALEGALQELGTKGR